MTDESAILPPAPPALSAPSAPGSETAQALLARLARRGSIPDDVLALVDGPLAAAVATAADYAAKAITPQTVATYQADWSDFAGWARQHGVDPAILPIHPVVIAAWLATLAPKIGRSALRRRVAAIAYHHRSRGQAWQSSHRAIRQTLAGIVRAHRRPVRPAAALTSDEVKQLIAVCPSDLAGLRDRALFLVGLAGAFRRAELVGIDVGHLRFTGSGVTIHLPRSKNQAGEGADVALPRGRDPVTCPVRALETWLQRAKLRRGPVFRRLTAAGTIEGRLTGDGVWPFRHMRAESAAKKSGQNQRVSDCPLIHPIDFAH